ncbi:MAG: hypothetical protein ACKVOK_07725 [Flavobacteriales bacterium]
MRKYSDGEGDNLNYLSGKRQIQAKDTMNAPDKFPINQKELIMSRSRFPEMEINCLFW